MTEATMTPLRQRMIDDMTIRNMSPNTTEGLRLRRGELRRLPRPIAGQADVRRCSRLSLASRLARLRADLDQSDHGARCASSTASRSAARRWSRHIPYARKADTLPPVLTREEVVRFLKAVDDLKMRDAVHDDLCRGPARLRGRRLDGQGYRQRPHGHPRAARQGSQRSLRHALRAVAGILRAYWKRDAPADTGSSPAPIHRARSRRGPCNAPAARPSRRPVSIKTVTVHTLRHSFATHLLEQGVDIRVIQDLLGHRHINSTTRYARVAVNTIRQIQSPLERLNIELTPPA